ncbi:hypothetical protein PROFUN_10609 [Planoprotostelium fungivorum]|uniref:Molybdenum cofactor sulfurase n=1 Tax=Planoprotostelium fungivorum TaxID=1890364 RepID=A0A2P6ND78_9EUKA|nr:hypothetical protein PROFUN_10609 [Planoprotostelium fungivorum]
MEADDLTLQQEGYGYQGKIEEIRQTEFGRLKDVTFLDYCGTAQYGKSQLDASMRDLSQHLYGNPHSSSSSSGELSHNQVQKIRHRILEFFHADPQQYAVIFTSGCTAGLKIVGEYFSWHSGRLLLHDESHTSVLGMREYAYRGGAQVNVFDSKSQLMSELSKGCDGHTLVAFPGETNFSGKQLPLQWINDIHDSDERGKTKVLLDAAALCSHSVVDLEKYPADFVVLSFYKIFGYPTGCGALIVKRDSARLLDKIYFGGGTVAASLSNVRFHKFREDISSRFEDGSISFLSIISLRYGFDFISLNFGSITQIERHTLALVNHMYRRLSDLQHDNGTPVVRFYGDLRIEGGKLSQQGPVLAFNLQRANGEVVGFNEVNQMATLEDIHLRTGCFCNPGACHKYLGLSHEEVMENIEAGHVCWDDKDIIRGKPTGAIRVSIGAPTLLREVETFIDFVGRHFVERATTGDVNGSQEVRCETLTLSEISVYPIKSCGRHVAREWHVHSRGLSYDREWVLIDVTGSYLNQKKNPKMATISPHIDEERQVMIVRAPDMMDLEISLTDTPKEEINLSVCGDDCGGFVYPNSTNQWFSSYLDTNVKLVRTSEEKTNRYAGDRNKRSIMRRNGLQESVMDSPCPLINFSNESQYLIVCEASVEDVKKRMEERDVSTKISAATFRPNLLISGGSPFQEDSWKNLVIGDHVFEIIGPCNRCKMICIDQTDGTESREPLYTLSTFRREKGKIYFGMHAIRKDSSGGEKRLLSNRSVVRVLCK